MATHLGSAPAIDSGGGASPVAHHGPGAARRLLAAAAVTASVVDVGWMLVIGEVIPPLVGFGALVAGALIGLRRRARAQAIVLLVQALLVLGIGGQFFAADAQHPEAFAGFTWAVLSGGGRIVTAIAAIAVLRQADAVAVAVRRMAMALAVLLVGTSGFVATTANSDARQSGDVAVPAVDSTFPEVIEVAEGGAVFVENVDGYRHTFSVRDTEVDVDLPPNAARRVELDLAPGTYQVHCTVHGHEAMTSTLVVR